MNLLLCTLLTLSSATALYAGGTDDPLAARIDLGGVVLQHGKNVKRTSDGDLIQASNSYDYLIAGTVTGSGALSFIEPGTNLAEALEQIDPGFSEFLDGSVVNPSGKQKFTVLSKRFSGSFQAGPFPAKGAATIAAGIAKSGELSFSIKRPRFTAFGVPVNGKITFDPGSVCNVLVPSASNLPQRPDLVFGIPNGEALGNNVYADQTISGSFRKGNSAKAFLLLQNDGTLPDSFTLQGPAGNDGIALAYFDGKTNITDEVVAGTFAVSNVASRMGPVVTFIVSVKKFGATLEGDLTLRSSTPELSDVIHLVLQEL